jgi:hypothetical protein
LSKSQAALVWPIILPIALGVFGFSFFWIGPAVAVTLAGGVIVLGLLLTSDGDDPVSFVRFFVGLIVLLGFVFLAFFVGTPPE